MMFSGPAELPAFTGAAGSPACAIPRSRSQRPNAVASSWKPIRRRVVTENEASRTQV
jgi:hypothetical protein